MSTASRSIPKRLRRFHHASPNSSEKIHSCQALIIEWSMYPPIRIQPTTKTFLQKGLCKDEALYKMVIFQSNWVNCNITTGLASTWMSYSPFCGETPGVWGSSHPDEPSMWWTLHDSIGQTSDGSSYLGVCLVVCEDMNVVNPLPYTIFLTSGVILHASHKGIPNFISPNFGIVTMLILGLPRYYPTMPNVRKCVFFRWI